MKVAVLFEPQRDKKVTDGLTKTAAAATIIKKQGAPKTKHAQLQTKEIDNGSSINSVYAKNKHPMITRGKLDTSNNTKKVIQNNKQNKQIKKLLNNKHIGTKQTQNVSDKKSESACNNMPTLKQIDQAKIFKKARLKTKISIKSLPIECKACNIQLKNYRRTETDRMDD